jgi:hypothetical protein
MDAMEHVFDVFADLVGGASFTARSEIGTPAWADVPMSRTSEAQPGIGTASHRADSRSATWNRRRRPMRCPRPTLFEALGEEARE